MVANVLVEINVCMKLSIESDYSFNWNKHGRPGMIGKILVPYTASMCNSKMTSNHSNGGFPHI